MNVYSGPLSNSKGIDLHALTVVKLPSTETPLPSDHDRKFVDDVHKDTPFLNTETLLSN